MDVENKGIEPKIALVAAPQELILNKYFLALN
jgi:hypothetical protein